MNDGSHATGPEDDLGAMNPPAPDGCFHCGLPLPTQVSWRARVDGAERAMCCPGCAAAAQAIVDAGCADYYATRSGYGATVDSGDAPGLALYDTAGNSGEGSFTVEGIRCAACVWLIERHIDALPGVIESLLNVSSERLQVRWDPAACKVSDILRALRAIGYTAYPYDSKRHGEQLERARRKLFRQLFVAGLSMMQVMMYAVPVYLADDGTMDADMAALMGWASFVLTLPALLYSALPFFSGAWRDLRRGLPGMDVPVALGIAAAFIGSTVALVHGAGEVWFDSITMFIFLLLGSRYLELTARRRAARALETLQEGMPASAARMPGYPAARGTELVAAARLRPGDVVLVAAGQAAPADGVILEGETEADLSLLTGESKTRRLALGDLLPGGAVNVAQAVVMRVEAAARDSTLALLVRLVDKAGQGKPALALWADRVAAWSVAALLVLTVVVFAAWQLIDPARAWPAAIAVLVVTCPCALSLATPTALAAATDRLLRRGVLAVQPHALETLERATHVVFDKTGTLTLGRPVVRDTRSFNGIAPGTALATAAALEAGSAHPLAQAIRNAASAPTVDADNTGYTVGQGIEGSIAGERYRLGSAAFVGALVERRTPVAPDSEGSAVWLGRQGAWLARFDIADALRPEALDVVRRFEAAGKTVVLLSGDESRAAQQVATRLGIRLAAGDQLPQQKLDFVRELQAQGATVAMVGDGINDAAVLRGADVSFALGGGAALAQLHADCVLLGDSLLPLCEAADTARRTSRIIRQNLAWASIYNLCAIPLAATGLLSPWLSGAGMAASSAVVVLNALRLRK
ncbi:heavy metal translocating P-type ATPase [Massilia sp. YIM B02769]|uniref:heavy metal translocating P-type ATPase n=1 Tax=Massilia sp. YIM B02769 TaxID=3050129 RepID=UPI0025B6AD29|nr:heavy metal translocating P-type ATPase [Massilia sp. YIM B02769]MDN4058181.1 heavy metal translocating P-type ATPase [Massilia sp. YIM B02769]